MPRRPTGSLRRLRNGNWEARIELGAPLGRKAFELLGVDGDARAEAEAVDRMALLNRLARALRGAGHVEDAPSLLEMAAARRGAAVFEVVAAVDVLCVGRTEPIGPDEPAPTFRYVAEEWTSGKLHERFPDYVKAKDSTEDATRLDHLFDVDVGGVKLGDVPIDRLRLDHAEAAMRGLPERVKTATTRRHYAQLLHRVLALAVYPMRLIPQSPLPKGFLPKVGKPKARTFLYPAEEARLMACTTVDATWRLFFGILAREGCRTSEALGLTWRDVDLDRGVLTLEQNKTDDPRAWAMDPGVVRALGIWRKRFRPNAASADRVFVDDQGTELPSYDLAGRLRAYLLTAGVDRREVFTRSANRAQFRAHDLRGTFVTLALASGKSETWVADRTGHTTSAMINRYRRAARSATELNLGQLLPLDVALPELHGEPRIGHETDTDQRLQGNSATPRRFELLLSA